MALKYGDLCERCQTIKDTTPPGDTITVCTNCSRDRDTAASLTLKLEKKTRDKSIPDSIAMEKIKPLARQRGRLTKRIKQIGPLSSSSADVGEEEDEEEGDLVKGPLETMFKQLIRTLLEVQKHRRSRKKLHRLRQVLKRSHPLLKHPFHLTRNWERS